MRITSLPCHRPLLGALRAGANTCGYESAFALHPATSANPSFDQGSAALVAGEILRKAVLWAVNSLNLYSVPTPPRNLIRGESEASPNGKLVSKNTDSAFSIQN